MQKFKHKIDKNIARDGQLFLVVEDERFLTFDVAKIHSIKYVTKISL